MIGHSGHKKNLGRWFIPICVLLLGMAPGVSAQIHFESGSTGADGALVFEEPTEATTIIFDPTTYDPPLDPEGDNIFHFTTIYIPQNLTLRLNDEKLGSLPVVWLAQGEVQINGTIDLDGEDVTSNLFAPIAGAGGFRGGLATQWGNGPGGGHANEPLDGSHVMGGGGGHALPGAGNSGGRAYGNQFLMPMVGGSGGGGGGPVPEGFNNGPAGGGSGGGAILIASSVSISFNLGAINANGGIASHTGYNYQTNFSGGGGSGGAIRLVAPEIGGVSAYLRALGGGGGYGGVPVNVGSNGRIRIESYEHNRHMLTAGSVYTEPMYTWGTPLRVFPPETAPKVRVTSIDGTQVSESSRGFYLTPDVEIVADTTSTVTIKANYVPVGTEIQLTIQPEYESQIKVTTTPLQGTLESSTAEALVRFPPGFSRGYVFANWTP